jgi:hypothetical protein
MQTLSRGLARLLVLGGATLTALPAWAATAQEKSLPGSTIAFIRIGEAASFRKALQESQFGHLLADPALKPLLDDSGTKLDARAPRLGPNTRKTLRQLWDLAEGELTMAVVPAKDPKMPFALIVSADGGKNAKAMLEALTNATNQAAQNGDKVTRETLKGMPLTVIRPGKPMADRANPLAIWTNVGSVFYVGVAVSPTPIRDVLGNLNGRTESLADTDAYKNVMRRLGTGGPMTWYVAGPPAIELASEMAAQQGMDKAEVGAQLELVGLDGVLGVGGTYTLNSGEFDTVAKIFFYAPGQLPGLMRLFKLKKESLRPEPWVPADVAAYRTMNFDFDNAYVALNEFANQFADNFLKNFEQQLVGPDGKKLDIKKQIFAPLGNRITMISDPKKPITAESQRRLFAVPLDDAKTARASLITVFDVFELKPKKREFQGVTIYDVDLSQVANQQGAPPPSQPISVAIANDTLFVSMEATLLEQVLRPGGPSLADSPAFQAVAKHLPAQSVSISYVKTDDQLHVVYERIKNGQIQEDVDALNVFFEGFRVADFIDAAKLPDYSVIGKHLLPGGGFAQTDDEGATITQFTLKPANP